MNGPKRPLAEKEDDEEQEWESKASERTDVRWD